MSAPDAAHEVQLALAREAVDRLVVEALVHVIAVADLQLADRLDVLLHGEVLLQAGDGRFKRGKAVFAHWASSFFLSSISRSSGSS